MDCDKGHVQYPAKVSNISFEDPNRPQQKLTPPTSALPQLLD
jgi:hypothetical protein